MPIPLLIARSILADGIFAIFAFAILSIVVGTATPLAGIGKIVPNSAAESAGFLTGDKILSIDDQNIKYFEDLRNIIKNSSGVRLSFLIQRGNETLLLHATPRLTTHKDKNRKTTPFAVLGVEWNPDYVEIEHHNPFSALWIGVERTVFLSQKILSYVADIFLGNQNTDDLGGPLRIAKISGDMAQKGIEDLLLLMAVLSVNLGLINLFPIPMLDGGHLLFYAIEGVLKRPLGEKAQEYSFRFGLILIISLFVFVSWNDIIHF